MDIASTTANAFVFHPREIAFCGYSGSGKTTLISRLIGELSASYAIGYVKHDAHQFVMDTPGKDTYRVRQCGAAAVGINDADHWALVSNGEPPPNALRAIFAPMDMVFVEGYKNSALPKVVVVDEKDAILDAARNGQIGDISAFVGRCESYPGLGAPYFFRDDLARIQRHVLSFLGLVPGV